MMSNIIEFNMWNSIPVQLYRPWRMYPDITNHFYFIVSQFVAPRSTLYVSLKISVVIFYINKTQITCIVLQPFKNVIWRYSFITCTSYSIEVHLYNCILHIDNTAFDRYHSDKNDNLNQSGIRYLVKRSWRSVKY